MRGQQKSINREFDYVHRALFLLTGDVTNFFIIVISILVNMDDRLKHAAQVSRAASS